jgi:Uncharacterized protein conserved in bacteria
MALEANRMKRLIVALLTAGFFTVAHAEDKALLYQVSGKDLPQPSYLYGTFHLVCPTDLKITDTIQKAMSETKQLYLEIDFDDPSLQSNMLQGMMLGGGKTLKDYMKADDFTLLDAYLKRNLGNGLGQLGGLQPIALLSAMYITLMKCQPASYDLTFAEMAGKGGKEVLGLETIQEQLAVLGKVPIEQQLEGLVEMARRPDEAGKELTDLIAAYKAQDLDLLMKLMRESKFDSDTKGFEDEILDKRNQNWIPIIEKAAHDKSTFFAFGAAHLAGEKGVVSLLRAKGYTVKPLP